jgi:ketosteroid isomerase-like protein
VSEAPEEERLARQVLAALSEGDNERFGELAADDIEIRTARGSREGHAEAVAWAANKYDHLHRTYAVDEIEPKGRGRVVVRGRTQYRWNETGGLADESPVEIEMRFRDEKLVLWRFLA